MTKEQQAKLHIIIAQLTGETNYECDLENDLSQDATMFDVVEAKAYCRNRANHYENLRDAYNTAFSALYRLIMAIEDDTDAAKAATTEQSDV